MKKLLLLVGLVVFLTPMVVSSEENLVAKFNHAIDNAFLTSMNPIWEKVNPDTKFKGADWFFFGVRENGSIVYGFLNEKSKSMRKTPVYTGKILEGLDYHMKIDGVEYYDKCKISAHFSKMKKYFHYEEVPTKAHSVPFESCLGNGMLSVPMNGGWQIFDFKKNVGWVGKIYLGSLEDVKAMFKSTMQSKKTTTTSTSTSTSSSTSGIKSDLSNWRKSDNNKKLKLIETYFIQILKIEIETVEEKNELIEWSSKIIKCVDAKASNISIEDAIGQCFN